MVGLKLFWFVIGFCALVLAALGLVLPLLPTTPFLILAAFAFARSSERWHNWLLTHRIFGPLVSNWRRYGAIGRRTKMVSVLFMAAILCLSYGVGVSTVLLTVQAIVLLGAAAFVVSRPSPPGR
ncbi:MAG: YbaN family protein [Pseudomonadota bacterium]